MARGTATDAANKWAANTTAAVTNGYLMEGVRAYQTANPNTSPSAKAAQNQTFWLQQVTANANKWAANSTAVTTADWVAAMNTKAVANIPGGVTAAQSKFQAFMGELLNYIGDDNAVQSRLPAKNGQLSGGIARATAWITYMSKFKAYSTSGFTPR